MVKKISKELKPLRECYQAFHNNYWEAVRMLGEYYHSSDLPGFIEMKFRLEKNLLLREFVESMSKGDLPEIILIRKASGGVSVPVNVAGKFVVDMGRPAREAKYYLPRVQMTYSPWRPMGLDPSPEVCPDNPKFIGVEKLLQEKSSGLSYISPESREEFEGQIKDKNISSRSFGPEDVDAVVKALEEYFANSPNLQKLDELKKKIQEAEKRRDTEKAEAEKKYYSLLRQRVSDLIDILIAYSTRYRLVTFVEYGQFDSDHKKGYRKFFLMKERKLISAPYKSFLGFKNPEPNLKKAADLPDKQWLRFCQMFDIVLLNPFLTKGKIDYITTSEPWEYKLV
jgi:hypothetical protein